MATVVLFAAAACLATIPSAHAHIAAFAKGMYCQNGSDPSHPNLNSNKPVNPLYQLPRADWWFQHDRGCDAAPPPAGEFLELPAGGSFTVELANNQAFTSLSYGGEKTSAWPDGAEHPEDWNGNGRDPNGAEGCIPADEGGYMHTQNETMAQGTAFAIAYHSELADVQMEDLVVFSVLEHTPWKRLATYDVPASLPACPSAGCVCAWLWVPRGCGQPNMYMQPFRCTVTNTNGQKALAKAQPPIYCAGDPSRCVTGAKQMIVFNQAEGDNTGFDAARDGASGSPAYNARNGFMPGAQEDIFVDADDGEEDTTTGIAEGTMSILPVTTSAAAPAPAPAASGGGGGEEEGPQDNTSILQNSVAADSSTATATATASAGQPDVSILPFPNPPVNHYPSPPQSAPHSYTTTLTGRIGRPTKFTCYAEED